jgi:regulator of RNase E activity RraA
LPEATTSSKTTVRPGFRLVRTFARPTSEVLDAFAPYPAALLSDVQGRISTLDAHIHPLIPELSRVVGPALTVKSRPGDNLMAMKAIELAQPGDVIVISCDGETNLSVWGGIMSVIAARQGVAGVVADGLVRDAAQIREARLPMFATGLTPAGPTKNGPGQINTVISCGGVVVRPGDIVVGDEDGVVVVPRDEAGAVLERAAARAALEADWLEHIGQGDYSQLIDTDEKLLSLGCMLVDAAASEVV